KRWTWLVAPMAWGRILNLTQRHPELNLKLVDVRLRAQVKIDGEWTKNKVALTPGKFIPYTAEDRARDRRDVNTLKVVEKRGGKIACVKYENGNWGMQVDGKPFVVKGVTYTPT